MLIMTSLPTMDAPQDSDATEKVAEITRGEADIKEELCVAFAQMGTLAELGNPNVRVRDARLYVENEKTLKMGAGKTFQTGVHKVTEKWNGKKVTNNKRTSYEPQS